MFRKTALTITVASLFVGIASCANAATLSDQWYVGAGYTSSILMPRSADNNVTRTEEAGQGATVILGRDFDERSSGQFQLYSLGDATFSDDSTATYTAADASLLYRFYDSRDTRRYARYGVSFYGRFGFGFIDRNSTNPISSEGASAVYFGAGAGLETYLSDRFAVRTEFMFHDRDAVSAGLTLVGRFGGRKSQRRLPVPAGRPSEPNRTTTPSTSRQASSSPQTTTAPITMPQAVPLPSPNTRTQSLPTNRSGGSTRTPETNLDDSFASMDPLNAGIPEVAIMAIPSELSEPSIEARRPPTLAPTLAPAPAPKPIARTVQTDADNDGITDDIDQCPDSNANYPVREKGCSLFSFMGSQIKFTENSPLPLPPTERVLQQLAAKMNQFPETRIELIAHTDSSQDSQASSALTRQRLRAIGIYLAQRGISQDRFLLRSFGNKRPAFSNQTAEGRRANNRIEINEKP